MKWNKADKPREEITVDYAGFHGPVVSAWVWDNNDLMQNVFLKSVQMIGYECESEDHNEDASDCDCVTEDTYIDEFLGRMAGENLTIVVEDDEWMVA